ncbi:MAG: nucleotide sugar dehydrogenase, partial [Deltaproteobacteria bacterium]
MLTLELLKAQKETIGVVGLGYVGLPLAVHLAAHFRVVGFDLNSRRIGELCAGIDRTREVATDRLENAKVEYTDDPARLSTCRFIIVAVPTPIDGQR